jgi:hypothetical protein
VPARRLAAARTEAVSVARGRTATHRHLRDRLLVAAIVTIAIDVVATVAIFFAERHAPGSEIRSLGSAAFWTTAQLLTVSSNFPNPISTTARVIDIALELYAITVVGVLAGSFGAFFHRRGLERDALEPASGPPGASGP